RGQPISNSHLEFDRIPPPEFPRMASPRLRPRRSQEYRLRPTVQPPRHAALSILTSPLHHTKENILCLRLLECAEAAAPPSPRCARPRQPRPRRSPNLRPSLRKVRRSLQ